jgi:MoaA/NifB/PqqE/SkfB family radical SAM enzyme
MISEETYNETLETIFDKTEDPRLKDLNAIVLLSLKQKGRGVEYTPLSQIKFNILVETTFRLGIKIGFDSCSSHKFLEAIKDHPDRIRLTQSVEPCESSCFSSYIDVDGNFAPCSFASNSEDWIEGIKITEQTDFIKDIWYNDKVINFRKNLLACKRACPLYEV